MTAQNPNQPIIIAKDSTYSSLVETDKFGWLLSRAVNPNYSICVSLSKCLV